MKENNYVLPNDVNSEHAVIHEIIKNFNGVFNEVSDLLRPEDFYFITHRKIFEIALIFKNHNMTFDYITLINYAKSNELLEKIGGVEYIKSILNTHLPGNDIYSYCRIVKEKAVLRELSKRANNILKLVNNNDNMPIEAIIDSSQKEITSVNMDTNENTFASPKELLREALSEIEEAAGRTEQISGIKSHYDDLDNMTLGFQKGDLIIIAGRPSMGKTTFSLSCLLNAAVISKAKVGVFSLEMPKKQLTMKMLSSLSSVDLGKIRKGNLSESDWGKMTNAFSRFNNADIFIDDEGGLTPSKIRSRARKLKREKGLDIILIDYLQLMNSDSKNEKKNDDIGDITRSLKALAKELQIPVILLSQLNRSLEGRPDKRPKNSDLRDSGNIEQDADVIILLYRDEVYNPESEDKGTAEIIIGKQRNGEIGTVVLRSELQYSRFANFSNF